MRPIRFGLYTAVGCVPWIGGLAWAGYAAGANWQRVQHLVSTPTYIIAGLIALLVIAGVVAVIVRRRKRTSAARPGPATYSAPVGGDPATGRTRTDRSPGLPQPARDARARTGTQHLVNSRRNK
jgi:hypothetical protein